MRRTAGGQPATISGPNEASAPENGLKLPITMVDGAAETGAPPVIAKTPAVSPHARASLVDLRNFDNICSLMTFSPYRIFQLQILRTCNTYLPLTDRDVASPASTFTEHALGAASAPKQPSRSQRELQDLRARPLARGSAGGVSPGIGFPERC